MTGFWRTLKASLRKSSELRHLSRVLGAQDPSRVLVSLETGLMEKNAEEKLFDLIEAEPALVSIMVAYHADRNTLRKSYKALCLCGAGEWTKGYWVPARALAMATTLPFVLANADASSESTWIETANRVFAYFDKGEVGIIPPVRRR
jgi:hypothetical protein